MRGGGPAVVAAALMLSGCASEQAIAAGLSNAAHPPRLPDVFACWEKEFEAAGFQGEYVAVIDLHIDSASRIHDAKVRSLEPTGGGSSRDPAPFRACLEEALNRSSLPVADDKDGPGFHTAFGVELTSLRVAFTDSPARKRAAASGRQANVLVGPRADRCQGLYSHSPPRDGGTLYDEIAQADARIREDGDPDRHARELQKKYDAELELIERLTADLAQAGLPEANKARLKKALSEVTEAAKKTGARIGCKR